MPVSMNNSWTSRRRHGALLIRYSLSPERYTRRVTSTSAKSSGRCESALSKISDTSAMPVGWRVSLPLKITSCMWDPRNALGLCSPSDQRMASSRLLLPHPLGPTMAVTPGSSRIAVRSAKDLNPVS